MTTRIGILGGGQLGRMIALAGYPLGLRTTVFDPAEDPCAGQVCGHLRGEFDDFQKLYELTRAVDVVTYEFENVPVETARWLAERVPVSPPPRALEVSQDRVAEKTFFRSLGIGTPPFAAVETHAEFLAAVGSIGLPAVLKTRRFGYDGKGQAVLRTPADAAAAWESLGGRPLILEGFVPFVRELSCVAVRDRGGNTRVYEPFENEHREGMLYRSLGPAPHLPAATAAAVTDATRAILDALDYVGVLAVEWFDCGGGTILANEMAPRVHNSGHGTIEGAVTSQFENHARAVAGMPLGSAATARFTAMFNLIGVPIPDGLLHEPAAKLHWYGKEPKPRRKVGHVTYAAATPEERDAFAARHVARFD